MRVRAEYQSVDFCPLYVGNPLIEALPQIPTTTQALDQLLIRPVIDMAAVRALEAHLRLHSLSALDQLYVPRQEIGALDSEIGMLIRAGYSKRNPILPSTTKQIYNMREQMRLQGGISSPLPPSVTLTGLSGLGKSRSIKAILSRYPQVIQHSKYQGKRFAQQQITWISIDASINGSITGFLLRSFAAIDRALGVTGPASYVNQYGRAKISVDAKIEELAQIAATFHLGVLHIDDLQRLAEVGSKKSRPVINLIIQLANVVKVPLLLSGTPKMVDLLAGSLEATRRVSSEYSLHLEPPESSEDKHFQVLLQALEAHQFMDRPVTFDAAWRKKLFYLSQGLPAVLLTLVKNAQKDAIRQGASALTLEHLDHAYRDHCALLHLALEVLRKKEGDWAGAFEDALPIRYALQLENNRLLKEFRKSTGAP